MSRGEKRYVDAWTAAFGVVLAWSDKESASRAKGILAATKDLFHLPPMEYVAEEIIARQLSLGDHLTKLRIVHEVHDALVDGDDFCDRKANWDLFEARRRVETVLARYGGVLPAARSAKSHTSRATQISGAVAVAENLGFDRQFFFLHAIMDGALRSLDDLIKEGAEIDEPGETNWTPLMLAVRHHRLESAEWLVEHRADLNGLTADGRKISALMIAAENGDTDMTHLLLRSGANPNMADAEGRHALNYASQACRLDTLKILLSNGAVIPSDKECLIDMFWMPTFRGRIDIVKTLLAAGANLKGCRELLDNANEYGYSDLEQIYKDATT